LARVAAHDSGGTEAERANAALRCCELISKHGLDICVADPDRDRRRPRSSYEKKRHEPVVDYGQEYTQGDIHYSAPQKVKLPQFHPAIAAFTENCFYCGRPASGRVMRRAMHGVIQYAHESCWREWTGSRGSC
jgi:hypothetical protein